MIKLIVRTVNSLEHEVQIPKSTTGLELKNYIRTNLCSSLEVNQMTLYYEGTKISNSTKLGEINIVVGDMLKVIQDKMEIGEISNIIANVHGIDPISEE